MAGRKRLTPEDALGFSHVAEAGDRRVELWRVHDGVGGDSDRHLQGRDEPNIPHRVRRGPMARISRGARRPHWKTLCRPF